VTSSEYHGRNLFFGPLVLVVGIVMLVSPVTFVRLTSPKRPLFRSNDPDQVRQSFWLRLQWRVAGAMLVVVACAITINEWALWLGFRLPWAR
jgi:hypothetical protein